MELINKHCQPCKEHAAPLDAHAVQPLLACLEGWEWNAVEGELTKQFHFPSFAANMQFVNQIASLAEAEGHHPDLTIQYDILDITLSTHVISGLSENDFILAAKIDRLPR